MRQRVMAGGTIEALTPDELVALLPRPEQVTRVRAPETVQLDGNGNGQDNIYKVPIGYEFYVRRVSTSLSNVSDPNSGVLLNAAGHYIAYYRSDMFIEYGAPTYGSALQVPGIQTWGDQQGPYLRNGEVFQVKAVGLTPNIGLDITVEGILRRPSTDSNNPSRLAGG